MAQTAAALIDNFSVNEDKRARRIEEEYDGLQRNVIDEIVKKLKEAKDWKVVSFYDMKGKTGITTAVRPAFLYQLQASENIIARPRPDKVITKSTPVEYKYVDAEEKKHMGYDAYFLRRMNQEAMKNFDIFIKEKDLSSFKLDVMVIFQALYFMGATKGWVKLSLLKTAASAGIAPTKMIKVLSEFKEKKIIVTAMVQEKPSKDSKKKRFSRKPKLSIVFVRDEADYNKRMEEAQHPENIKWFVSASIGTTQQIATREVKEESLKSEELKSKFSDVIKQSLEVFSKDLDHRIASTLVNSFQKMNDMQKTIDRLNQENHELKIKNKIAEQQKKAAQNHSEESAKESAQMKEDMKKQAELFKDFPKKAAAEKHNMLEKFDKQKAEIERLKEIIKQDDEIKKAFITNAQMNFNTAMGKIMGLTTEFTKKKHYELRNPDVVNGFMGQITQVLGDTSNAIVNFTFDKSVPNLYS